MSGFDLFVLWLFLLCGMIVQESLRSGNQDFSVPLERSWYQAIALFLVYFIG